jgi:hypothetical protein
MGVNDQGIMGVGCGMRTFTTLAVSEDHQPHLWRLVRETADRVGVPAPEVIELYPVPDVEAADGRLLLGLPYVTDLDADELAAVIAHELAYRHTRQGWVVGRLPAPEPCGASVAAASSGPLAQRAALCADAVAARTVSPETVAAALVHASHISLAFERFVLQYVEPLAAAGWYPVDLWAGWRWTLRRERDQQTRRRIRHGLAARVTALLGSPEMPGRTARVRPVPLRPLGEAAEAGFARVLAEELAGEGVRLRPVTFDGVSDDVWDAAVRRRGAIVRTAVAGLLDRPAAYGADVLALVSAGRAAEILQAGGSESPDLASAARVLMPLVVEGLRRAGYRYDHPLRQHVLVGPDADLIDVLDLLEPMEDGDPAPPGLTRILLRTSV